MTGHWVADACRKHGPDNVLVSSFTKAAAVELINELSRRDQVIDDTQVGTLHAICYRAYGKPEIAEGKVKEWNEHRPHLALGTQKSDIDDAHELGSTASEGDKLMQLAQKYRALLLARESWPDKVANFQREWDEWKLDNRYVDFTDLIEQAPLVAPGAPTVGFFDETQDLSRLELQLARQWAKSMEYVVLVGDADQCIYGFKGADPETFINKDADTRVLEQSYRIPASVHRAAEAWIRRSNFRYPAVYKPREEEGYFRLSDWSSDVPQFVDEIARTEGTHMVLASCGYMLKPIIRELRDKGLPFHNPYRTKNGSWNPMKGGADRLLNYLLPNIERDRRWRWDELWRWVEVCVAAKTLNSGMKSVIQAKAKEEKPGIVSNDDGRACFGQHWDTLVSCLASNAPTKWLSERLSAKGEKLLRYALTVNRLRGPGGLRDTPRVVVGTIHSVKGGQADHVWLSPDVSRAGQMEWLGTPNEQDGVRRLFYVGMTRAKKGCTVLHPSTTTAVGDLLELV